MSPDARVRLDAGIHHVQRGDDKDIVTFLETRLARGTPDERRYATDGLAWIWSPTHPEARDLLREHAAHDEDPAVRRGSLQALHQWLMRGSTPTSSMPEAVTLLAALEDPDVSVRELAVRLVASLEIDDAAPLDASDPESPLLVARRLSRLHAQRAFQQGVAFGRSHSAAIAKNAPAGFLFAEMGVETGDLDAAEEGYRACVDVLRRDLPSTVHGRPMVVPGRLTPQTRDDLFWACTDGLGAVLLRRKRYREAVESLDEALIAAKIARQPIGIARAKYNLACAHANLDHREVALANLRESIALNPAYAAAARSDGDLAPLRDDPRFRALVP